MTRAMAEMEGYTLLLDSMHADLKAEGIKGFVQDGHVDKDAWNSAKIKCLFILKEPVGKPDRVFPLTDFLKDGAKRKKDKTWKNVARWMYCIHEEKFDAPYRNEVKRIGNSADARKKYLKYIAAINLKKQPGASTTSSSMLREQFAAHYAKWLPQQLRYFSDAQVIVCCGRGVVIDCLMSVFDQVFDRPYDRSCWHWYIYDYGYKKKVHYYKVPDGPLIIDFYHPSYRISDEKKNDIFRKMIEELVMRNR